MRRTGRIAIALVTVLLLVLTAACAPTPEEITPAPEEVTPPPEEITPAPEEVTPAPEEITPAPEEVTPTPTPEFFLAVTQPADNSIISTDKVEVRGRTSPDAVVSINGELAEVDEEGNFTMMVVLEEGPNIIEVIASDLEGNQESRTLVIMYVP